MTGNEADHLRKPSENVPVPSEIVENPKAVLETDLSDKEKLKVLEKAEAHAEQMMNAAGEGMTGDDLPVLDDVRESIDKLKSRQLTRWPSNWDDVRAKLALIQLAQPVPWFEPRAAPDLI